MELPMKILVIDDSKTERLFLRSVLVRLQHDVEVAAGGTEGIQLCESFDPDLILLDVVMPEISGYETARILRASRDEWMPIIFLSGCGDAGTRRDLQGCTAVEAGASGLACPHDHHSLVVDEQS